MAPAALAIVIILLLIKLHNLHIQQQKYVFNYLLQSAPTKKSRKTVYKMTAISDFSSRKSESVYTKPVGNQGALFRYFKLVDKNKTTKQCSVHPQNSRFTRKMEAIALVNEYRR